MNYNPGRDITTRSDFRHRRNGNFRLTFNTTIVSPYGYLGAAREDGTPYAQLGVPGSVTLTYTLEDYDK